MSSILNALRKDTQQLHTDIEIRYPMNCLLSKTLTVEQYTDTLLTLKQWYCVIETKVFQQLPDSLSKRLTLKPVTKYLLQDLTILTGKKDYPQSATSSDWLTSEDQALGSLYVLLGSSLGSKLILRHLTQCDNILFPHSFYEHNAANSANWAGYVNFLTEIEPQRNSAQREDIVFGATQSFQMLLEFSNTCRAKKT